MPLLSELAKHYKNAPKMSKAIEEALSEHGDIEAFIIGGLPSFRKGSNIGNFVRKMGWKNAAIYYGAHRQHGTQGWSFVVVNRPIEK